MTTALTGATGFVGTRLVTSLVEDGGDVRCLVHPSADATPLSRAGVTVVSGDVRDPAAVARALAGAEVVYHLAGAVPGTMPRLADYRAVNVGGTENVVRAALAAGVRHLVHCSTVAVHGSPARVPADEDAPLAPVNAYETTKLAAERAVDAAVEAHGLSATIARLTSLYGPGDRRSLRLYRDVARGRVLIIGAGTRRCHPTYVDDAVRGLRACGARAPSRGARFIIGGEERPTIVELVTWIAAELGVAPRVVRLPAAPFALARRLLRRDGAPPGWVDRLDFFLADHAYDVTKATRELDFRAAVPLREGIRRTVAWYREHGLI